MRKIKNIELIRFAGIFGNGRIILGLFCTGFLMFYSCIEPYQAEIDEELNLVSIEGSIIKGEEEQILIVSRTTALEARKFEAIYGCEAAVIDESGNYYFYSENEDGTYTLRMPDEQLRYDNAYKLHVKTPDGEVYESEYEKLVGGAEVDTVYHQIEVKYDNFANETLYGLQFYIDLKAPDSVSRYYKWNLVETFEYNSTAPISFYYTGNPEEPVIVPDDPYGVYKCWRTQKVQGLFLSNTISLTVNEKKRIPLHYVSTKTDRLKIKYSLLVKQYSLNERAYEYWQKAKTETQESGGLYTQQPGKPITNFHNVRDSTEIVLGYFWVSNVTERRIFVSRPEGLTILDNQCDLIEYNPLFHGQGPYPRYIYLDLYRSMTMTSTQSCFDCTLRGGSTTMPDFWE